MKVSKEKFWAGSGRRATAVVLAGLAATLWGAVAHAADVAAEAAPAAQPATAPADAPADSVLGPDADLGGLRSALKAEGITLDLSYTGEVLGNVSGGKKQGAVYDGLFNLGMDVDLGQLAGWSGATFHVNAFQINGQGLSGSNLGNLMTVSGIEAGASTRLDELWLQQEFLGGKAALRAGMLAVDSTFLASDYAGTFVNATFGFPAIDGVDLPNGGPAYPHTTPGLLLTLNPTDALSVMTEVQGSDPLLHPNDTGTDFDVHGLNFAIGEAKYSYSVGKLPGAIHVGGWYDGDDFADQRFTSAGLSIADPRGTGQAALHHGNSGIYAMLDQMLYQVPGSDDQGLGMFVRAAFSPPDRNLIDAYVDGGFTYRGLLPGRPDDTFGIAGAFAHISGDASSLDRDTIDFSATPMPIRDYEALIELTYRAKVAPGLTLQPDFQYIFHPGGNVADTSGEAIKNAAVFDLRLAATF